MVRVRFGSFNFLYPGWSNQLLLLGGLPLTAAAAFSTPKRHTVAGDIPHGTLWLPKCHSVVSYLMPVVALALLFQLHILPLAPPTVCRKMAGPAISGTVWQRSVAKVDQVGSLHTNPIAATVRIRILLPMRTGVPTSHHRCTQICDDPIYCMVQSYAALRATVGFFHLLHVDWVALLTVL